MAPSMFASAIISSVVFHSLIAMTSVVASTSTQSYAVCPQYLRSAYGGPVPCWLLDNGNCYCFSLYMECWSNANYMCTQGGMSLVAIETGEEDSVISRHLMNIPELKGYAYWTAGRYNDTEWQWFSNKKPITFDDLKNTDKVKDKEAVSNRCILLNYVEEDYPSGGYASRICASFGYRFVCEATAPSQ
ncbi:hypothetical protein DAPPUDRAFT_302974 [Daphnia pulex]|uniref:C-type lectin domain-containing protein n=1 Tax=Daphnia pulex TaxID=6669 RepID=E9FSK9_DAPPU|nr:hypothetical protein DAPPUDRAFT_302974 [Daphnia pulex]|eukprot:EFX89810.1 hypothetical protein DAPPUDRAFT_302974 [Daphnia pulex]